MPITKEVSVSFQRVAMHRWPHAPIHRFYLRSQHRHNFHVRVTTEVTHNEREVEFHDLLEFSEGAFTVMEDMSCEAAAERLCECVKMWLPSDRAVKVEVSEDGECSALVSYTPDRS